MRQEHGDLWIVEGFLSYHAPVAVYQDLEKQLKLHLLKETRLDIFLLWKQVDVSRRAVATPCVFIEKTNGSVVSALASTDSAELGNRFYM